MHSSKQITYTIHKLAFLLDKIADQILEKQLTLSFSQFRILIAISKNGGVSQKQIAAFWEVTEAAVSRHVHKLIGKNLITIKQNAQNRRENILTLTKQGEKQLKKAFEIIDN